MLCFTGGTSLSHSIILKVNKFFLKLQIFHILFSFGFSICVRKWFLLSIYSTNFPFERCDWMVSVSKIGPMSTRHNPFVYILHQSLNLKLVNSSQNKNISIFLFIFFPSFIFHCLRSKIGHVFVFFFSIFFVFSIPVRWNILLFFKFKNKWISNLLWVAYSIIITVAKLIFSSIFSFHFF